MDEKLLALIERTRAFLALPSREEGTEAWWADLDGLANTWESWEEALAYSGQKSIWGARLAGVRARWTAPEGRLTRFKPGDTIPPQETVRARTEAQREDEVFAQLGEALAGNGLAYARLVNRGPGEGYGDTELGKLLGATAAGWWFDAAERACKAPAGRGFWWWSKTAKAELGVELGCLTENQGRALCVGAFAYMFRRARDL